YRQIGHMRRARATRRRCKWQHVLQRYGRTLLWSGCGLGERGGERPLQLVELNVAALMTRVVVGMVFAAAVDPADRAVASDQERDRGPVALVVTIEPVAAERRPVAVE